MTPAQEQQYRADLENLRTRLEDSIETFWAKWKERLPANATVDLTALCYGLRLSSEFTTAMVMQEQSQAAAQAARDKLAKEGFAA